MVTKAKPLTLTFEVERETKNKIRFQEVTDNAPRIGTLYVDKTAVAELGNPDVLKVTVGV